MTGEAEDVRRDYWAQQMDAAHRFMTAVLDIPIEESLEPLLEIPGAAEEAGVEIEFSRNDHERGLPRLFYLREGLIESLLRVARDLNEAGFILRIEDALRTQEMQVNLFRSTKVIDRVVHKVFWEVGHRQPPPDLVYRRLMSLCATIPKTGTHIGGTAVDVSVLDRGSGDEIDRGGPYIELSERTPMASPFVPERAREHRRQITDTFLGHGFVAYPYEFWHYSKGDVYEALLHQLKAPVRYGPVEVDLSTGAVAPLAAITEPLGSLDEIMRLVRERLEAARG